jgi:hypothetical protein
MRIMIAFHWPHNRFCLGWEVLYPDEDSESTIVTLFLLLATIEFEW